LLPAAAATKPEDVPADRSIMGVQAVVNPTVILGSVIAVRPDPLPNVEILIFNVTM
jgi:hypothetical protein